MIISGKQISGVIKTYADQNKTGKVTKENKGDGVSPKRDEIVLSSTAQEFAHTLQALRNMPEVRQEKVDELNRRIEAGQYDVGARDIADKMLAYMKSERLR